MATAHGIVILDKTPVQFSVTARVRREGSGHLYLRGRVAETFPDIFMHIIKAVRECVEFLDCPNLDCADITLTIDTPNNYPLAGASHGLSTGIAILAAATFQTIPSENCYTGCINGAGLVTPVRKIQAKSRGAAGFGFKKLFLPQQQLNIYTTHIAQCPVETLADAYASTFWED